MIANKRGQFQFVALLITIFGIIIYAAIYPLVTAILNPLLSSLNDDITKIILQLVLPSLLLGIITWFYFLSSPSGSQ